MQFTVAWWQWVMFAALLIVFVSLAVACILEPKKQRAKAERETHALNRFLSEWASNDYSINAVERLWDGLSARNKEILLPQLPELMTNAAIDAVDLQYALKGAKESAVGSAFTDEACQTIARGCITRNPGSIYAYDLARETWGTGKIPTDIILTLLNGNADTDLILQREIRPDQEAEIATHIAKKGDWEHLEDLFGKGNFPETCVRIALETHQQKNPEERSDYDVMMCLALLKEWENVLAFSKHANVSANELLAVVQEAPVEIREKLATQLAEDGKFWDLVQLFNPKVALHDLEMPPPVVPQQPLLRTCLERLKADMAVGSEEAEEGLYERLAAECAILLEDLDECQKIADRCVEKQYADTAGELLYFIHRTRREQSMAASG